MIACMCKYSPFAIFEGFNENGIIIDDSIEQFTESEKLMHPSMCSYSKGLLDKIIERKIDKVFLVNCCDAIRRLKDTLEKVDTIKFIYIMDLPKKNNCCSKDILKKEILKFIKAYEDFSGKKFDLDRFNKSIYKYVSSETKIEKEYIKV